MTSSVCQSIVARTRGQIISRIISRKVPLGVAFSLAMGLGLIAGDAGAALAQSSPAPDIWALPDSPTAPAPAPGDTPRLDLLPIDKTRMELDIALRGFDAAGNLRPLIPDLSAYSDETVRGLDKVLAAGGDPCTQAVRAALYLDAHLEEADWTERLAGYERKIDLWAKIGTDIIIPDDADRLAMILPQLRTIVSGLKAYKAYETAQSHYAPTAAVRNGIAVHDIVEQSLRSGWTEADIQKKRAELLHDAQDASARMLKAQSTIDAAMKAVDTKYDAAARAAFEDARRSYERLYDPVPDWDLFNRIEQAGLRNILATYDSKMTAAGAQRVKDHQQAIDASYALMNETQFATDRALAQYDALARYAAPIARGACSTIRRDGPASKAVPDPVETVLTLPHDKLMVFLGSIGVQPSLDLMNCVCRKAGYGSSGTSQIYHPDTIGTYDKRYSCNHPGPPCVVSGFGCTRHPLPSDPDIWTACGASAGQDVPAAIRAAVKARQEGQ